MRRRSVGAVVLVVFLLGLWWWKQSQQDHTDGGVRPEQTTTSGSSSPSDGLPTIAATRLPAEARETIALIKRGGPFPYRRDGITFENREHRLPEEPRGYYREYTVPTPGENDRGARRIITGGGSMYWTPDHYRSFARITGTS